MENPEEIKLDDLPDGLREVAELVAEGLTDYEIAARRSVAWHTVRTQVKDLFLMTGINRRVMIVKWVMEQKYDDNGRNAS